MAFPLKVKQLTGVTVNMFISVNSVLSVAEKGIRQSACISLWQQVFAVHQVVGGFPLADDVETVTVDHHFRGAGA